MVRDSAWPLRPPDGAPASPTRGWEKLSETAIPVHASDNFPVCIWCCDPPKSNELTPLPYLCCLDLTLVEDPSGLADRLKATGPRHRRTVSVEKEKKKKKKKKMKPGESSDQ